jgi:transposase InsO family protein
MANHRRAELVNQALSMALYQRQPAAGLIMHTDRGSQYGADSYRQLLTQHGIQPSMQTASKETLLVNPPRHPLSADLFSAICYNNDFCSL